MSLDRMRSRFRTKHAQAHSNVSCAPFLVEARDFSSDPSFQAIDGLRKRCEARVLAGWNGSRTAPHSSSDTATLSGVRRTKMCDNNNFKTSPTAS